MDGYANFGGPGCSEACVSTNERQARERASAPEPAAIGRAPSAVIALGDRAVVALSASDANGLWAVRNNGAGQLVLAELGLDGESQLESALPSEMRSGFRVFAAPTAVLVYAKTAIGAMVKSFDQRGQELWTSSVTASDVALVATSRDFGGASLPDGSVVSLRVGDDLRYLGREGEIVREVPLPPRRIAPFAGWATFATAVDGELFVGETARLPSDAALLRRLPTDFQNQADEQWSLPLSGDNGGGLLAELDADAAGGAYVLGALRSKQMTASGSLLDFGWPFLAHVDARGELGYVFHGRELVDDWGTPSLVWNSGGEAYLGTVEDPIEYGYPEGTDTSGLCSVWGCSALVLRKLSARGDELWSYQHRKHSMLSALSLSTTGVLVVAQSELRDAQAGQLLLFSTE